MICCSVEGEVRGYLPPSPEVSQRPSDSSGVEQKRLEELNKRKQVGVVGRCGYWVVKLILATVLINGESLHIFIAERLSVRQVILPCGD